MHRKVWFYEGPIGAYALCDQDGHLTRVWLGDRLNMIPDDYERIETDLLRDAHAQLSAYFERRLFRFDLPFLFVGTAFQMQVWSALRTIPYGETITYAELAEQIGRPKAVRAVGSANGKNPLPIFFPCHRVIGKNGDLTGYTGGLYIKKILLDIERQ